MKLKNIIEFLDSEIPKELAMTTDNVGLMGKYDLSQEISSVKILMDLYPQDDCFEDNTLVITHHPPLFTPKTPTYTIHSNWDIINGGANDALAKTLKIEVMDVFDKKTGIGRICKCDYTYKDFKNIILKEFTHFRTVNEPNDNANIKNIGIISGFGLKNTNYINLANAFDLDILISGDLTQETAVLAKNINQSLIDLGHHESEIPGLHQLKQVISKINIDCEVIDNKPIKEA